MPEPDDASDHRPVPFLAERGPFAGTPAHLDAPYVPTPPEALALMLDLARVGPGDRLIDLGSGDGGIVIEAARRGARAVGIEIDPARIGQAKAAVREAGMESLVRFEQGDLFTADLSEADVVTLFLLPHINRMIEGKLREELKPGSRVVGYCWPMPTWTPAVRKTLQFREIYLWVR